MLRGVTPSFAGRVLALVVFNADLSGLAEPEGRSVVGFFSILRALEASAERLPIEALVGEVDLGGPGTDARLAEPFIVVLILSGVSSPRRLASFRFVIELRDARALSPGFAVDEDAPRVAGRRD